ncbi:Clp1-domain-containing protein [Rickenella mellea]|uniref:Polynucleotide 5'-hydroxyl-kinase GRC3 n=1 Tax=Rickenella mellea TaxID=50990 RepID=A0A4Y7QCM0_9AGAM|nr:Clp1-domain-containing protein [Rickenella mellea]
MSSEQKSDSKEWILDPETEYRFELDQGTTLAVKLTRGHAEIFGAELAEGKTYLFGSECKAAVFTWQGCTIQVTGQPSVEYVSDETPMDPYINLHLAFEQMRVKALRKQRNSPTPDDADGGVPADSPRVLVLGPENAGKTTACKILTNYAVRTGQGWCPMLVNIDPSEGGWTVPGTISACAVSMPIPTSSPANPLGSSATSAPTALSSSALLPIVYWFGHAEVRRNPMLMDRLIRNLGENVVARHDVDTQSRISGIIVDTPSSFAVSSAGPSDKKYGLIKACIDAFQINVIVVVGHEKLNVEMQRLFGSTMSVVKIPKSGGVVELDLGYRERVQRYQIHNYFYGQHFDMPSDVTSATLGGEALTDLHLSPLSTTLNFSDITIYRIGGESIAPSSALPIGATRVVSEMQPIAVDPSQRGSGLLNAVLALLSPPNPDENERYDEEVLDLDVVGFIIVTALDIPNRKMTVLSPSPGSITGRIALMGSLEYQEQ